jgi:predicted nucleic-acid-binding protein
VLRGAYKSDKQTIVTVLKKLLGTAELSVETPDLAWAALDDFEKGNADYSDCLIAHKNREAAHIRLRLIKRLVSTRC